MPAKLRQYSRELSTEAASSEAAPVPNHNHRIIATVVGSDEPLLVSRDAGAPNHVAVALEQHLLLGAQVSDDSDVPRHEENRPPCRVGEVVDTPADFLIEPECPLEADGIRRRTKVAGHVEISCAFSSF